MCHEEVNWLSTGSSCGIVVLLHVSVTTKYVEHQIVTHITMCFNTR
jgi:hypothetical protein